MKRWTRKKSRLLRSKFRSKFEERLAYALTRRDIEYSYESTRLEFTVARRYTPDFILSNGVMVEAKGYFTSADRTKHLRVRECNPDADIRFCFQNASNKLNKTSKTSYADWCDRHGFLWCEKIIPDTWVL